MSGSASAPGVSAASTHSHPRPSQKKLAEKRPGDFVLIETEAALSRWLDEVREQIALTGDTRCCLDTEADSLHHYKEKLCLLQVAFAGKLALVDPLAVQNVTPLLELLDQYELWFHGADYDLTMLRRTYGWAPKVVRDTQIAARLVGYRQFGLAALLHSVFGLELSKASQKADWSRRPLPEHMQEYAVDDVRYLLPLADHLEELLEEKGRGEWFQQSCRSLQEDVAARSMEPREDPWRVQGSGRLHAKGLAVLQSFWQWREGVAEEKDIPCYRIMSNKQLVAYAEQFDMNQDLVPPNGWRPRWKKDFESIIQRVLSDGPASWPARLRKARGRLSDRERQLIDQLCAHRDSVAVGLDIESSLLGSRSTLEQVVAEAAGETRLMQWQRELLVRGLEAVKSGSDSGQEAG